MFMAWGFRVQEVRAEGSLGFGELKAFEIGG